MSCTLVRVPKLPNINNRRERRILRKTEPLLHALHVNGDPPFTPESVTEYKERALAKLQPVTNAYRKNGRHRIGIAFSHVMALVAFIALSAVMTASEGLWLLWVAIPGFLYFMFMFIFNYRAEMDHSMKMEALLGWRKIPYEHYLITFGVPKKIGVMAKETLLHCPDAELSVAYLYKDPFLVAEHPKTEGEVYFGVWDEHGFVG